LLFLCPKAREASLTAELGGKAAISFTSEPNFRIGTIDDKTIWITSWRHLLNYLDSIYAINSNAELSSDIKQLIKFCDKMDDEGFLPLSNSDIDCYHGRLCHQLASIIGICNASLRLKEFCDFSGLKTASGLSWYGFYFRIHGFGCCLYFSTLNWYARNTKTPFWIAIKSPDWQHDDKILTLLKTDFGSELENEATEIGISIKPGLDKDGLALHIVNTVKLIADQLQSIKGQFTNAPLTPTPPLVEESR